MVYLGLVDGRFGLDNAMNDISYKLIIYLIDAEYIINSISKSNSNWLRKLIRIIGLYILYAITKIILPIASFNLKKQYLLSLIIINIKLSKAKNISIV